MRNVCDGKDTKHGAAASTSDFSQTVFKRMSIYVFRNYTKLADLAFLHCFVVKGKTRLLISRLKGLSLG